MKKVSTDTGCSYTKLSQFDTNHAIKVHSLRFFNDNKRAKEITRFEQIYIVELPWAAVQQYRKPPPTQKPLNHSGFPYERLNTVLLHHALEQAGVPHGDVSHQCHHSAV